MHSSGLVGSINYDAGGNYVSGRELRIREEIAEREGITHVGGNYKVGRNHKWEEIPESGEMHEWEEITEPAKVQEWERFPSGEITKCGEITVLRGICKSAQNDDKFLVNMWYD